jgi:hypothetical protein
VSKTRQAGGLGRRVLDTVTHWQTCSMSWQVPGRGSAGWRWRWQESHRLDTHAWRSGVAQSSPHPREPWTKGPFAPYLSPVFVGNGEAQKLRRNLLT